MKRFGVESIRHAFLQIATEPGGVIGGEPHVLVKVEEDGTGPVNSRLGSKAIQKRKLADPGRRNEICMASLTDNLPQNLCRTFCRGCTQFFAIAEKFNIQDRLPSLQ